MNNSDDDEDEDALLAEIEGRNRWAKSICNRVQALRSLAIAASSREGLNPDLAQAAATVATHIELLLKGEYPSDIWQLELKLSQGSGDSHGTRIYSLMVDEEGLRANCHGSEWRKGVGTDSWSGAEFIYRVGETRDESGDFSSFVIEFEEAIADINFEVIVRLNDEIICQLPEEEPNDSASEKLIKRIVRGLILELQTMDCTLSGEDSALENVWDEICVQQIEESVMWEVYEMTVQSLIAETVRHLPRVEQIGLWLSTPEGEDWSYEIESEDAEPSPCSDDSVRLLFDRLMATASDYSNPRTIAYGNRLSD